MTRGYLTRERLRTPDLNDYTGRRNVTLAGVTPTPFDVAAK